MVPIALLLMGALALPYFFNAESQRSALSSRLEAALGRKVKLGRIRLGLFPPALRVGDAEIAEALGFTNAAFSTAKELRARVRLWPLLHGRLEVPSIELEEPTVNLVKNAQGDWNFASFGRSTTTGGTASPAPSSSSAPLEIGELRIRKGSLTVTDLQKHQPTARFTEISLTLKNFSRDRPFDFEVSTRPPSGQPGGKENSRIEAKGQGGPLNPTNLAESPAEGEAHFRDVDLGMLDPFTEQAGLGGLFTGDAKFSSSGKTARVEGDYRVEHLRLSNKAGVAQSPVVGKFRLIYDSVANRLNLEQFDLGSGNAVAHTAGHLLFGKATTASTDTKISGAALSDIARLLPALGVRLPAGSSLSGGTLTAQMSVRGPVALPSRRGSIDVRNARLTNYNIAGQLGSVIRLAAGVDTGGRDTVIEQFKTAFVTERGYTNTSELLLAIPGMNITGQGGFSDAGTLNLQAVATLTRAGSAIGGLLQKVTGSSNTVPFRVTGTFEHPIFQPDVGKMVQGKLSQGAGEQQQGGASKILKGLGGLFGKKQ